jgi:hypothetical protein
MSQCEACQRFTQKGVTMNLWDRAKEAAAAKALANQHAADERVLQLHEESAQRLSNWTSVLGVEISDVHAHYSPPVEERWNVGQRDARIETSFTCEGRQFTALYEGYSFSVSLEGRWANTLEELGAAIAEIEQSKRAAPSSARRTTSQLRRWLR